MKKILLIYLCIQVGTFGITQAYADDPELFKSLSVTALSSADVTQNKFVDQIKQKPTTESVNLVTLDVNALSGNTTRMSLPNAKVLYFNKSATDVRSPTDLTWIGTATNDPSKATLVVHDGNITGTIRDASGLYRIEPVGNGVHAVIKVNESRFPPDHPPSFKTIEKSSQALPSSLLDTKTDACPGIDVLVAYTPAARIAVFDIASTIQLAVAEANQSYVNSGINIKLNLVDTMEVAYTEVGISYDTILADFTANTAVKNRRDSSGADMAAMIINQADYCGMADAIMADATNAYAVVHYDCATGYYSFAHELGHLQGARHDPANDPTSKPFAYGHGFQHTASPSWRTIMAYNCAGNCSRIQYWSNPNVTYNTFPMGTADLNDNARVLNGTACTVAGFKSRPTVTPVSNLTIQILNDDDNRKRP
ncbi:MAG: M12 family metallo-peptidase [Candidatus Methylumidiphilus sp.]